MTMGMNFPSPATPGQIYAPPGGPVYRFDDPIWTAVAGAGVPLEGVPEAPVDGTQYGRQSAAWTPVTGGGGGGGGGGSMTAAEILTAIKTVDGAGSGLDADLLDGQSSAAFAVASHTHAYSSLTSIPSTFAPSAHSHPTSDVTGLDTALTGKAPTVHTHAQSDVTNLTTDITAAKARANHTGTQTADTLTDGTTNKAFLATERTKLTGIATAATANSADATLLARANHTGSQLASTISDFSTAADARVALKITNKITVASSAPGSPATNDVWIDTT